MHRGRGGGRGEWNGGGTVGQLQSCVHNSANAPQGAVTLQMGQIISMFPRLQREAHALTYTHPYTHIQRCIYKHTLIRLKRAVIVEHDKGRKQLKVESYNAYLKWFRIYLCQKNSDRTFSFMEAPQKTTWKCHQGRWHKRYSAFLIYYTWNGNELNDIMSLASLAKEKWRQW